MATTSTPISSRGLSRDVRLHVREATADDAVDCGRIFYDAFESIAAQHNLPVEPSSREFTDVKVRMMLADRGFSAFVAEHNGQIVGSVFADERAVIVGIGPVTVSPGTQDQGAGRELMDHMLLRQRERGAPGVRVVQTAYHYRSLALYAKLGFEVREALSVLQGAPPQVRFTGYDVRQAEPRDCDACLALCRHIHGHDRSEELKDAIGSGTALVVEHLGRISGYATGLGYGSHAVAETNEEIKAMLASAERYLGLGVLLPSRNGDLLRWCLDHGLRIVQQSTLMSLGLYNRPTGAYLPSVLF
ncbi:MAG: GNAT family N-acetyltransferase [Candidatus Dormibacteria bacterium]